MMVSRAKSLAPGLRAALFDIPTANREAWLSLEEEGGDVWVTNSRVDAHEYGFRNHRWRLSSVENCDPNSVLT
jgi:hypothetical protein